MEGGELLEEAADEAAVERGGWRSHVFLFKALPLSGGACRDPFRNSEFYRLFQYADLRPEDKRLFDLHARPP